MSMMMEQPRGSMYAVPPAMQPMPAPTQHSTTVVVNQPQSGSAQRMQVQQRDWNSGLCACFDDCLSCFLAYCFPCCFSCYIACRLDENCMTSMCVPGGDIAMRTKLRTMNGIRGSICGDCFTVYLCYQCQLAQMARELKITRGRVR